MRLSEKEIDSMKHCVGLDYKNPYIRHGKKFYRPYRNRYATYVDDVTWNRLFGKGMAKHIDVGDMGQTIFFLTRKGLDALGEEIGVHIYDEED